ncbi:hypothetical protein F5Y16DRAFT_364948 [Xylariaceae sp. FL0255]|nr:hypothetical protein F5Y16DRAFT_364948 [Xylariaceae sp. FL0255]
MESQHSTTQGSGSGGGSEKEVYEKGTSFSDFATEATGAEKSLRRSSSTSHWPPEPGFQEIDGEVNGKSKLNETTVDIIAVPCLGASPIDTWARDPLGEDYFSLPPYAISSDVDSFPTVRKLPESSVLTPTIDRVLPKASHVWIRHGIRREVDKARVLLYRHRELVEGVTIEQAADDLLEQIVKIRSGLTGKNNGRPLFFICHSVGGLVVKQALVKASLTPELKPLVYQCHGITFFATPHRGSSYLSMPTMRESIQELLFLEKPLPFSITEELAIGYKPMLKLHDMFTDIASEIRIWTFYETVDSPLSGMGWVEYDETHFSAPITSIKSCLVRTRVEQAISLESDHAHCASFGPHNLQTMHLYLKDLAKAVRDAETLSLQCEHTPLKLNEKVRVEIIGFYEDPDGDKEQDVRLYVSKHLLKEFFDKGPEVCLRERLTARAPKFRKAVAPPSRRLSPSRAFGALGLIQGLGHRLLGSSKGSHEAQTDPEPGTVDGRFSPEIVVRRPSVTGSATEPALSTASMSTSPRRSRGLTVPALSTPGFHKPSHRRSSSSTRSDEDDAGDSSDHHDIDISPLTITRTTNETRTDEESAANEGKDFTRKNRHERIKNDAAAWQDYTAGFSRPDPQRRKFMWIHLPFNNPYWVKGIFNKLSEVQNRSYSKLLSNDYWTSKHVQGRNANYHVAYVKPGCAFVPAEANSPRPQSSSGKIRSPSPSKSPAHFYLYLPYIHYDTYINIVRRRKLVERRLKQGRARPVPKDVADLDSLEAQVIWEYIGHDPPLNMRRSIDQYGYPSLPDTWARDDDQMLYKLTKDRDAAVGGAMSGSTQNSAVGSSATSPNTATPPFSQSVSRANSNLKSDGGSSSRDSYSDLEDDIIDGKCLMVDQLWLWAVDTTTIMTFFPKRESSPTEGPLFQQADLRNSIYNELNGDLTGRCENALDLAAFITLHAVTVLIDRSSHPDLEIFRIFEEALGILTERMTSSLKRFRMQSYQRIREGSEDTDEDGGNSPEKIKTRHRRELERAERENRDNTSAQLELRDMEDEMHTLGALFTDQQETIKSMLKSYEAPELQEFTGRGRDFLREALRSLEEYVRSSKDMLERIDATRKDYEKLHEMIMRQAQVDEVRWSRLQTELASSSNVTLMIFTTFTVLFLPLSFFTSLFGMNTAEWGGADNWYLSLKEIGAISLPASGLLIAATLLGAFSSRVQSFIKFIWRTIKTCFHYAQKQLIRLEPPSAKAAKEKRRAREKEIYEEHVQRKRDRAYDFWADARNTARRSTYRIPDSNRRTGGTTRAAGIFAASRAAGSSNAAGASGASRYAGTADTNGAVGTVGKKRVP